MATPRLDALLAVALAGFLVMSSIAARIAPWTEWHGQDENAVHAIDAGGAAALFFAGLLAAFMWSFRRSDGPAGRAEAALSLQTSVFVTLSAIACVLASSGGLVLSGRTGLRIPLPLNAVHATVYPLMLLTYDALVVRGGGESTATHAKFVALVAGGVAREALACAIRLRADVPNLWALHFLDPLYWLLVAVTLRATLRAHAKLATTRGEEMSRRIGAVVLYLYAPALMAVNMAYAAGVVSTSAAEAMIVASICAR